MSGFKIPKSTKETETIDGYVEYTEILTLSNLKLWYYGVQQAVIKHSADSGKFEQHSI